LDRLRAALAAERATLEALRAECAQVSEEFDLPPTIRPAPGEIRRMRAALADAEAEVERLRRKEIK
jgi:hypothetical protein